MSVPCPCKKWDSDLKNYMLACLPSVGLIIGLLWAAACLLLIWIGTPFLVLSFIMTFLLFALCGFMHLDGFMDVCDAVLSRRDLPERRRILKDSHCGAFAVIGMVLLACAQWSVAMANPTVPLLPLLLIPVASRACAALAVLTLRPMESSQYAAMTGKKAPYTAFAALMLAASVMVPLAVWGSFAPLAAAVGYGAALWYACRQLGGMSGDVSGFALTLGELCGLAVLTLVR